MIVKVNFTKSGLGIEEGTVGQWLKQPGDRVERDEPIVEVETAKAIQEITAPVSGTLIQILFGQGETAAVNATLALIEGDDQ